MLYSIIDRLMKYYIEVFIGEKQYRKFIYILI